MKPESFLDPPHVRVAPRSLDASMSSHSVTAVSS